MTIEEEIFVKKRFVPQRMLEYGFIQNGASYQWESDFLDGDFHTVVTVAESGEVLGSVIDAMNDEEYAPLRADIWDGSYVNIVRAEYEALLRKLADNCCEQKYFVSDQSNRIADRILQKYGVRPDFPWEQKHTKDYGTFRHTDSGKWFGLIMNIKWGSLLKNKDETTVEVMNLKIDPSNGSELMQIDGIYPAYHMNHKTWISVVLDERLTDETVIELVDASYSLT